MTTEKQGNQADRSHTMARLQIAQGPSLGAIFPLFQKRTVIGRLSSADLQLKDGRVSRLHAQVIVKEGRYWLEDLGSRGGTKVNGERIQDLHCLETGDRISLGEVELIFQL